MGLQLTLPAREQLMLRSIKERWIWVLYSSCLSVRTPSPTCQQAWMSQGPTMRSLPRIRWHILCWPRRSGKAMQLRCSQLWVQVRGAAPSVWHTTRDSSVSIITGSTAATTMATLWTAPREARAALCARAPGTARPTQAAAVHRDAFSMTIRQPRLPPTLPAREQLMQWPTKKRWIWVLYSSCPSVQTPSPACRQAWMSQGPTMRSLPRSRWHIPYWPRTSGKATQLRCSQLWGQVRGAIPSVRRTRQEASARALLKSVVAGSLGDSSSAAAPGIRASAAMVVVMEVVTEVDTEECPQAFTGSTPVGARVLSVRRTTRDPSASTTAGSAVATTTATSWSAPHEARAIFVANRVE